MSKKRRVWRQSDQTPHHRRQVDVSARETGTASLVGVPLETRPGIKPCLLQAHVEATKHMQTEAFWLSVWSDDGDH